MLASLFMHRLGLAKNEKKEKIQGADPANYLRSKGDFQA